MQKDYWKLNLENNIIQFYPFSSSLFQKKMKGDLYILLTFLITKNQVLSKSQDCWLSLGEPGTGGSTKPSMVGAVKKWQKADPEKSQETWRKLSEANSEL